MSTPKQESPFTEGQTVVVTNGNYPSRTSETTITKVGRVNVYIQRYGREVPFDKFTGHEKRPSTAGGFGDQIRTPEMYANDKRVGAMKDEARRLGFDYSMPRYSADTLAKVFEILRADPAAPKPKEASK